jgi:chromosome segregation ATPase
MSENPAPSDQPGPARRFAGFLYRLLRAALMMLLFIGLLLALAWGGLWLYQTISSEIDRSAQSVATRFDAQESRIDILRREMDGLLATNPDQQQQLRELQRKVGSLESAIARLTADSAQKDDLLAALETALANNLAGDQQAAENLAALADSLAALQADFNVSTGQIDALGGEVDSLNEQLDQLGEGLAAAVVVAESASAQADESATAVTELAHSIILFHAWELVARARLHLLSENAGLAASDIVTAQETLAVLQAKIPANQPLSIRLNEIQTRLTLAAANLPGAPELAARDLENVWDILDRILVARLLPQGAAPDEVEEGS